MAGSLLQANLACGWSFTIDAIYFRLQYGQFYNEVDHMMLNLNTENDWNRGYVVVQWPGFVIYMT